MTSFCQAPAVSCSIHTALLLETTHFSTCINTEIAIKDLGAFLPAHPVAGRRHGFVRRADAPVCAVATLQRQGQRKTLLSNTEMKAGVTMKRGRELLMGEMEGQRDAGICVCLCSKGFSFPYFFALKLVCCLRFLHLLLSHLVLHEEKASQASAAFQNIRFKVSQL